MIGRSKGWPIVLSPPTDGLGLAIAEGIESSLSAFEATGPLHLGRRFSKPATSTRRRDPELGRECHNISGR